MTRLTYRAHGEKGTIMLKCERDRIEKAVKTINNTVNRVLIADLYEGYELRELEKALKLLLDEVDKK